MKRVRRGKLRGMPRAMSSGSISFGLLNVRVKLYSAVSRKSVSFRELRGSDGSRVRHKRVAEADGEEVPYEEIVKGYEISPEQYVVLTRDELEELDPKRTRAIEIQDFVDLEELGEDVIPEDGRKLEKREIEMAKQLIESLSGDFDAEKYRDEYREELLSLIERKARGEEVVESVSEEPKPTKAPDLMAALEES